MSVPYSSAMTKRFQIDDMIGEYRVTGYLGEGGMGVVYCGVHEKLGRSAAIKILGTAAADPSFKTRFMNEARLQAGLHHPNVATLYDFREQNDELVIFMELVDGKCLDTLIERRAFTVDESLTVFASICEAIAYIHDHGVIHRDIKAQNAKLTAAGTVKLLDFGIAKDKSTQGLTQTGGVIGTPNYLSPEQLEGHGASPQTDIWALGVLLYEMLTGQLPFDGDTLGGLVLKITKGDFPPPEKLNPAVTREVTAIVAKCLKRDTNARYRDVREIIKDVRRVLESRNSSVATNDLRTIAVQATAPRAPAAPASHDPVAFEGASGPAHPVSSKPFPVALVAAIGGGAFLLLLVGIVAAYFLLGSDTPSTQTALASNSPAKSKGNTRIHVDVDEGKAQVFRGGEPLGLTPLDLDVNMGDNVPLTLRRDGFEDKNVNIQVGSGKKVFTFSLKSK
jgi:serine/threonine protein kinase